MKYIQRTNNESTHHIDDVFGSTTSWTSILSPLVPAAAILCAHDRGKQTLSHSPCHVPSPGISANCRLEHKGWVNEHTLAGGAARILTNQSLAKIPETN